MINTIFLVFTVLFAFYWTGNFELSNFSTQAIGLLVLLYVINYFKRQKTGGYSEVSKLVDSCVLTMVILLVVLTTGGIESPAIFLIFILTTFISLILHPVTAVLIITLTALLLERDSVVKGLNTNTFQFYIWLATPIIITFISKQHLKLLESQNKIRILETEEKILKKEVNEIETEVSTFSKEALNDLNRNDLNKLHEDIESLPDKVEENA